MRVLGLVMIVATVLFSCKKVDWSDLEEDTYQVQQRLDQGETPFEIYQSGVPVDHIFGKIYQSGIIFYLDVETGEGLVCSQTDVYNELSENYYNLLSNEPFTLPAGVTLQDGMGAGEYNTQVLTNLLNESNTIFARIATLGGNSEWYLPSQKELEAIHNTLHRLRYTDFSLDYYWTSNIEGNKVICIDFSRNDFPMPVAVQPNGVAKARAVKKF